MRQGWKFPVSARARAAMVAGAVLCTVAGLVPGANAATESTPYDVGRMAAPEPQATGRWGERIVAVPDLDGDGVNDMFVAAPFENVGALTDAGRVYAVSSKTLRVLYVITSPEPQAIARFGFYISSPGDVNGDGRADIAAGTDAQDVYTGTGAACGAAEPNGCNEDQGRAWLFSGANGALLYTLDNPRPQGAPGNGARFGSRIGRAGDINADGVADLIVGASNNDVPAGCGDAGPLPAGCRRNQGQAFIFNGTNGALLRVLDLPAADQQPPGSAPCLNNCGTFGLAVQGPGDTDGDGVEDQLVNAGSYSFSTGSGAACGAPEPNGCNEGQGRMYLFSGRTGEVLLRIDDPEPQSGATFGFQDAAPLSPGDVNGDGFADLYANGFAQNGPAGASEGRGWVFNGRTGALLYTLRDPSPELGGQFGWSMAASDHNKDGVPDLYVGASPHHEPGASGFGETHVFEGRTGGLLRSLLLPPSDAQQSTATNNGPSLGWGLAAPGDINGDGEPDYLAGAPFLDVGANQDQGQVYTFTSRRPVGYTTVAADGGVFAFGSQFFGSTGNLRLNQPIVTMASTPNQLGYWLAAADGGIFAFGDAAFAGSTGAMRLNRPVVGMAPTPTGKGYWLVASDGGVFAFGDARFFGSTGALRLNRPVVGMAPTPSGRGYWLVASDGGVFAFGDARFLGSTGALRLNRPVVGMAATPTGRGYWLVASDGGIFAFGDATFLGSTGAIALNQPIVDVAPSPSGRGYWLAASDGGIFAFGDAVFRGSTGAIRLNSPMVGVDTIPPVRAILP